MCFPDSPHFLVPGILARAAPHPSSETDPKSLVIRGHGEDQLRQG